jgi:hypothetical protein
MYKSVKEFAKSGAIKGGLVAGGLMLATQSHAAAINIDVTDVIASLAAAVITVTAVCTAALAIVVAVKVFKYVRSAF